MQLGPLQSRLAASIIASFLLLILYLFLFPPPFAFAAELGSIPVDHAPDSDMTDGQRALLDYQIQLNLLEQKNKEKLVKARQEWERMRNAPLGDGSGPEDAAEEFDWDSSSPLYDPGFELFDESIVGRAADANGAVLIDADVAPTQTNINAGQTNAYIFQASSVSGRSAQEPGLSQELRRSLNDTREHFGDEEDEGLVRRQSSETLWISVNTCLQPNRNSPSQTSMDPPQLTLFVSTSSKNTAPGPGQPDNAQKVIVFDEGAATYNTSAGEDVYFSISAPEVSDKYFSNDLYNYNVSVSLEQYYYNYNNKAQPNLYWVDSDASATLFTTKNLTNSPNETVSEPPYVMFIQNQQDVGINGLRNSYCGLSSSAQIRPLESGTGQLQVGLKQSTTTNLTVEQFYISSLNASSNYTGILATAPSTSSDVQKRQSGTSAGGVTVYREVDFETKPQGACTFIFNLTLCTETQYAVPGNSSRFPNATALSAFYDEYTLNMYSNFEKVLQQTACEAPPTQRYSLVRDCDDCKTAYKNWLCSVAIPRCEDFSSDQPYLQARNIEAAFPNGSFVPEDVKKQIGVTSATNFSRNRDIDEQIQPGPYKEILPCDYLCYELVKSCPASMGFSCPRPGNEYSFAGSYAVPQKNDSLACNYPGSAYYPSAARTRAVSLLLWAMSTIGVLLFVL
ncbi:stretch-activated Ca2+-permeable channel component-domain-containing protein [Xylariaceae sp. FL1272]|nr:stretch-activated Ca2+-permeable channel component-domain-containing protein [Xylariaceae sp. FL1272]